jgi:hypothetical protein
MRFVSLISARSIIYRLVLKIDKRFQIWLKGFTIDNGRSHIHFPDKGFIGDSCKTSVQMALMSYGINVH